ncbi:MAG: class I SAM-dependent methyltransferase [Pseudomonadota bacterium]
MTDDVTHWASVAKDWIGWAQAPDHDSFWAYRAAFQNFIGSGSGQALEIGCGEGRVARALGALGYEMTVAEPAPALLQAAQEAGSAETYLAASATNLPVDDGSFDLVVFYNVLMDVDDLPAAMTEATRVLRPGGRLMFGIVHPMADHHFLRGQGQDPGDYFATHLMENHVETRGVPMHFRGWRRPLSAYFEALRQSGLLVSDVAEPQPDPDHPFTKAATRWQGLPLFFWVMATK